MHERFFASTNRLRSEGTDHLLAAADATGVSHVTAQSAAIFNGVREGGWVKSEEDPLEVVARTRAINHLEDVVVRAGGAVLRYGRLYGARGFSDAKAKQELGWEPKHSGLDALRETINAARG
jgi:dTDP-4-dehydrorhamnose reductase